MAWEPKGHQFDSQLQHMPGLWGQVPGWEHERGNLSIHLLHINVSLPLFLSPFCSLKLNKILKKNSDL